jgi:uncharacterized protein YbjT (DUF2867 family)
MSVYETELACSDLKTSPRPHTGRILVTGATGYIGGRLATELLARGYQVRVMVRGVSPEHEERWPDAEIAVADALEYDSLVSAVEGVDTIYYLIHSLRLGPMKFESVDIEAAGNVRRAAAEQGVRRIIYLGGLGDIHSSLSPHLRSRIRVAQELERGPVPATILRAAIIIGSGSASYEIINHLVRNTPIIPLPSWARTMCQPISIRDVIKTLVGVLELDDTSGRAFDIGGPEVLTYETMIRSLVSVLGKKRLFVPSPISNVGLYAYFISHVTPVPAAICSSLMRSITDTVVCQDNSIEAYLPYQRLTYREAILRAMTREEQDDVHTRWSDAYPPAHELAIKLHELEKPPHYISTYFLYSEKDARSIYRSFCSIGGDEGWFHSNWMWNLRGRLDRILMGVGTTRGRRSTARLRVNDVVDFWRVEDLKPDEKLLLRAEMKLPGRAWLEFGVFPDGKRNRLIVRAYYEPRGLPGKIYWYNFLPFHHFIFANLLKQIDRRS